MHGTPDAPIVARTTPTGRRVLALALLALLALGATACDQVQALINPPPQEAPKPEDNLPPAKVDLPPVPQDLGKHSTPEKHADGALTVAGLLRNRPKYLDKKVTVKGHITWIYDCPYDDEPAKGKRPPRRPKKKKKDPEAEPKMCDRPHMLIADKADEKERTMMVVGLTPELEEFIKNKEIDVGQEHTIDGVFLEEAEGFTAADYGLVQVTVIKGFEPKPPEEEDPKKK